MIVNARSLQPTQPTELTFRVKDVLQIAFRRFYWGRQGMHPLQQSDRLSDLRQVAFQEAISLPLWAQLFAFVIVACSPLVVVK